MHANTSKQMDHCACCIVHACKWRYSRNALCGAAIVKWPACILSICVSDSTDILIWNSINILYSTYVVVVVAVVLVVGVVLVVSVVLVGVVVVVSVVVVVGLQCFVLFVSMFETVNKIEKRNEIVSFVTSILVCTVL